MCYICIWDWNETSSLKSIHWFVMVIYSSWLERFNDSFWRPYFTVRTVSLNATVYRKLCQLWHKCSLTLKQNICAAQIKLYRDPKMWWLFTRKTKQTDQHRRPSWARHVWRRHRSRRPQRFHSLSRWWVGRLGRGLSGDDCWDLPSRRRSQSAKLRHLWAQHRQSTDLINFF